MASPTAAAAQPSAIDGNRVSDDGKLLVEPTEGECYEARWASPPTTGTNGLQYFAELALGTWTLRNGDYVYGIPEAKGDSMEVARIEEMFDTGDKDDNSMRVVLRILWRSDQIKAQDETYPKHEIFATRAKREQSIDVIEGYVLCRRSRFMSSSFTLPHPWSGQFVYTSSTRSLRRPPGRTCTT